MEPEGIVDFQSANSVNGIHDLNFNILEMVVKIIKFLDSIIE